MEKAQHRLDFFDNLKQESKNSCFSICNTVLSLFRLRFAEPPSPKEKA